MDIDAGGTHADHSLSSSGEEDSDDHISSSSNEENSDDHTSDSDDNSGDDGDDGEDNGDGSKSSTRIDGGILSGSRLFELGLGGAVRMGNAQQFRPLIAMLRDASDETQQLLALQELAELLAMATEETLIGVDISTLVQSLISLANGPEPELAGIVAGNANIMLLACRCLSNMLEALPLAGSVLLRHGAVDMLCARLLDIEYIDVAELALTVLTQLSRDSAARVCAGGGLSACLMFLDFFATSTQHTALTCAVNCARAIGSDQFPQAADAVPVLERTMFYSDQKTASLSCSALQNLASAFCSSPERIERLVSADLMRQIVASIRSDSSSLRDASVSLMRLLATVASASRERAMELLNLDVIPVLCGILAARCVDSRGATNSVGPDTVSSRQQRSAVHVSEQAWEALRLAVTLLPRLPTSNDTLERMEALARDKNTGTNAAANGDIVDDCCLRLQAIYASSSAADQLQHTMLPLMIRLYSSTVNTSARYRVLVVVLKIVFCLDVDRLRAALSTVDLPRFVVAAISLQGSPLLSATALLVIRVVLEKLPGHCTQRFVREGVVDSLSALVSDAERVISLAAQNHDSQTESENSSDNSEDSDDSDNSDDDSGDENADDSCGAVDDTAELQTLARGFKLIDVHISSSARNGTI
ncbi:Ubiquitin fusion degradation protein 4, partial [Coemansia sp. RSA 2618]